MFIKTDHATGQTTPISSETMVEVLEQDMQAVLVDDTLTEMVNGTYRHRNRTASYHYEHSND